MTTTLPGHEGDVTCTAFLEAETLVSADNKGKLICWRVESGTVRSNPPETFRLITDIYSFVLTVDERLLRRSTQGVSLCSLRHERRCGVWSVRCPAEDMDLEPKYIQPDFRLWSRWSSVTDTYVTYGR